MGNFEIQNLTFSRILFLGNFNIFDIFPGCQDLHPGTIQGIKLHMNKRFLTQNILKNHDFSSNVHLKFRIVHSTQNFIIYSEKNLKYHSSHFGGFHEQFDFSYFCNCLLIFHYKGPYQPISSPYQPMFIESYAISKYAARAFLIATSSWAPTAKKSRNFHSGLLPKWNAMCCSRRATPARKGYKSRQV